MKKRLLDFQWLNEIILITKVTLKKDRQKVLSNENKQSLCFQRISIFNPRFDLKTTKTPVFVFITEIL